MFAFIAIIVLVIGNAAINDATEGSNRIDPQNSDGRQNLTYAYNLARYGVFSRSEADRPDIPPDFYREPLYPALMALSLKLFAAPNEFDYECFVADETCGPQREMVKRTYIPLLVALAWATVAAARRWWAAYLCVAPLVAVSFFYINNSLSELPAALFLLLHAWFLYEGIATENSPRSKRIFAVLSGIALGLLILTKAIFFYWMIALAASIAAYGFLRRHRWRPIVRFAALLLLPALLLANIWMVRNFVLFEKYTLTSRSATVLAVRAEYSYMTANEYAAFFAEFSPPILRPWLLTFFDEDDYQRLRRGNPNSYYYAVTRLTDDSEVVRLARERYDMSPDLQSKEGEFVAAQLSEADDAALSSAAIRTILDRLGKHLFLFLPFAYQGSFVEIQPYIWESSTLQLMISRFVEIVALFFVPALLVMAGWALRKRHYAVVLFFAPALFSYAFHALATHYIPRYSTPLVPIFLIAVVLLVTRLAAWLRRGKESLLPATAA